MAWTGDDGHETILRLRRECKSTDIHQAMIRATSGGNEYIVRLSRECQLSQNLHPMVFYYIIRLYIFGRYVNGLNIFGLLSTSLS